MSSLRLSACTALAMLAFSSNSLLCRLALKQTAIDAASFTTVHILSGALASALGYVIWYRVLREMSAITASTVQLSAPVIAAVGGIILLDEALSVNLLIASALILGGIALVLRKNKT